MLPVQCQDLFPLLNVKRHIIRFMPAAHVRQVLPGFLQQGRVPADLVRNHGVQRQAFGVMQAVLDQPVVGI